MDQGKGILAINLIIVIIKRRPVFNTNTSVNPFWQENEVNPASPFYRLAAFFLT